MQGIGVEAVNLADFRDSYDQQGQALFAEMFTEEEREACFSSRRSLAAFAGLNAAKKALIKALPTGGRFEDFHWRDLEVMMSEGGQAKFRMAGRLLEHLHKTNVKAVHLSLAETADNAVAFVVVE